MSVWEEGIQSIYTFIRRTAEYRKEGVCWQTIDYHNKPHYNYNLFNGVGGIPLFLCDYYRYAGAEETLQLADKALSWCESDAGGGAEENMNFQRGLHVGKVGIAYARLRYDLLTGKEASPYCHKIAEHVLSEPCGPVTDFMGGEASNGFYFLKLYQKCGDARYLDGAKRCADWLTDNLVYEDGYAFCQMVPGDEKQRGRYYLGVSHGTSGVAYYLSLLYAETSEKRYQTAANELWDTILALGIESKGGLNWPVMSFAKELPRCQYSHGAVGIGMALVRASELLQRKDLLAAALQAGEASYAYGDFRNNLTVCTGVTGSGQFMLDLFVKTKDSKWLERAQEFATIASNYKDATPDGDAWPTDEPGLYSADYLYGASGVGHFFIRLTNPEEYDMPLF